MIQKEGEKYRYYIRLNETRYTQQIDSNLSTSSEIFFHQNNLKYIFTDHNIIDVPNIFYSSPEILGTVWILLNERRKSENTTTKLINTLTLTRTNTREARNVFLLHFK